MLCSMFDCENVTCKEATPTPVQSVQSTRGSPVFSHREPFFHAKHVFPKHVCTSWHQQVDQNGRTFTLQPFRVDSCISDVNGEGPGFLGDDPGRMKKEPFRSILKHLNLLCWAAGRGAGGRDHVVSGASCGTGDGAGARARWMAGWRARHAQCSILSCHLGGAKGSNHI